jgi:hypothetical protein
MALTNAYGTMQQLRAAAGITDANNTDHDSALEIAGNAAARMIDDHCGRRFWQDGTVQVRTYCPDEACEVDVDDISTTTGLIVKVDDDDDGTFETTWTINTAFIVAPVNAAADTPVKPYEQLRAVGGYYFPRSAYGRPTVQVTAKFGWPAVPPQVLDAWLLQSVQLYKSDAAPFGGVSVGLDGGVLRLGARLHPIAEGLLEGVSKPRVA